MSIPTTLEKYNTRRVFYAVLKKRMFYDELGCQVRYCPPDNVPFMFPRICGHMPTIDAIEKAVDDSFMWGQIDMLMYILNIDQDMQPGYTFMRLLLAPGGFEKERDLLFWKYTSWCLAHNLAVGALGTALDVHFNARMGFSDE